MAPSQHLASAVLVLALLVAPSTATAQRAACDTTIMRRPGSSNGYQDRGSRCEGIYNQRISGSTLVLASFTETFQPYTMERRDTMRVEWPASVKDSILLRAEALRRGEYYRLDAAQAADKSFNWPSRLLANERISGENVGIIGWTRFTLNGRDTTLYVPLRVRTGSTPATCGVYTVTLLPGRRLEAVFITLTPLDRQGRPGPKIRDRQPLTRSRFQAEVAIPIHINREEIKTPGLHQLRVDVRLSGGGTSSLENYLTLGEPCLP